MLTICFVVGARPNFPKVAPILHALQAEAGVRAQLVHTGQHYDPELSSMFFEDLGIGAPDRMLGVGSGSHAEQTAKVMVAFEQHCLTDPPDAVVVLGDVNSTVACALVGAKLGIAVVHVEAGLRSGDRSMPEELNRVVTDALSDRLYTHCWEGNENLAREGVAEERVVMAGNVMIDTLLRVRGRAEPPADTGLDWLRSRSFGLVTLHRPALVDDEHRLRAMLETLRELSHEVPLLYPVHPRTRARMVGFGLLEGGREQHVALLSDSRLAICRPIRYLQFLWLMDNARLVVTDSGGIQEETTVLGVPCVTVRENTERAVTIREGTNQLVGLEPASVLAACRRVLTGPMPTGEKVPPGWDGQAGQRIAADLVAWLRAQGRGA
jgi:UDP-N-acetylglucosamine 2-epimerase (non-hydrolysing)